MTRRIPWWTLPDEIVLIILSWVARMDKMVLFAIVPAVCRQWRRLCGDTRDVRLNLWDFHGKPWRRFRHFNNDGSDADAAVLIAVLGHLAGRFKHIVQCRISEWLYLPSLTNACAAVMADRCKQLINVNFNGCDHLSDASVVVLAQSCLLLSNINFKRCTQLTDASVFALAKHCSLLTDVNFMHCEQLTDASVLALVEDCPLMTNVNFGFCTQLTDTSVVAVAMKCTRLANIFFASCDMLTDVSVMALADHRPQLSGVDFEYCGQLTCTSLVVLIRRCPMLMHNNGHCPSTEAGWPTW
jgi:hypothetical protein